MKVQRDNHAISSEHSKVQKAPGCWYLSQVVSRVDRQSMYVKQLYIIHSNSRRQLYTIESTEHDKKQ